MSENRIISSPEQKLSRNKDIRPVGKTVFVLLLPKSNIKTTHGRQLVSKDNYKFTTVFGTRIIDWQNS